MTPSRFLKITGRWEITLAFNALSAHLRKCDLAHGLLCPC